MRVTSQAQYEATQGGAIPPLERVREGIWSVALPTLFPAPHVPYTLCTLVQDAVGAFHLIDTGADNEDAWRAIEDALTAIGGSVADIASVTVTHLHLDHLGLAARVREASGAPVALGRIEQDTISAAPGEVDLTVAWAVPDDRRAELAADPRPQAEPFTADVLLDDGDLLPIPGQKLKVVLTPGHTSGHIAVRMPEERILMSGDHLLPHIFPGIGLDRRDDGNPIRDYYASLDRILAFDGDEVLPAHGYRFEGLAQRVGETAAHHRTRTNEAAKHLVAQPELSVWELASRLTWTLGWDGLRDGNLRSALAQTAWHRELATG
jgi:glyoxylase-like metal-dependent hydrolase (beta-lactamase superfamily II)